MRKCHIAGFAVIGASALVSATAIAGRPYFHPQFHFQDRYGYNNLYMDGCEVSGNRYDCIYLVTEGYGSDVFGFGQSLYLDQYVIEGSVHTHQILDCDDVSPDTIDVASGARAVTFEVSIDMAAMGCYTEGYSVDYSTGEYGPPPEFPDIVSIRVLLSDPFQQSSSTTSGHGSTKDGERGSYRCDVDSASSYEDASVEINGSPKVVNQSFVDRSRCHSLSKP